MRSDPGETKSKEIEAIKDDVIRGNWVPRWRAAMDCGNPALAVLCDKRALGDRRLSSNPPAFICPYMPCFRELRKLQLFGRATRQTSLSRGERRNGREGFDASVRAASPGLFLDGLFFEDTTIESLDRHFHAARFPVQRDQQVTAGGIDEVVIGIDSEGAVASD